MPLAFLIAGTSFWFCGNQLAGAFTLGSPGFWGAWAWAAALWPFPVIRMLFFRHRGDRTQGLAYFLLGLGSTYLVLLLVLRLLDLALHFAGYAWPIWAPWAVLAIAVILCLWGWQTALGPAQVKKVRLPTANLHPDLEGLRIVQISDLHISRMVDPGQIVQLVEQVQALEPDLIAITGDLADGPVESLREAIKPLARLRAPLGVHYVTGNHEYFWGIEGWLEEFDGLGFEILLNAHRAVDHKGARLLILGVNDPMEARIGHGEGPDLRKAVSGAPKADYTLFLAHQPQAYVLAEASDADLFLTGHTHGGQYFPFSLIVPFFHRYYRGLYRHSDALWVYVHSGSGFWGPPNRLGVRQEVTLLVLEKMPVPPTSVVSRQK
jgi:hypothetical protein